MFAFDGGTNFAPATDLHVHDGWIRFVAPDRLEEDWTVYKGGQQTGDHKFVLTRKK